MKHFERLFQDDDGTVEALHNITISSIHSVHYLDEPENVVLLWIEDSLSGNAFRLFIDSVYCGIDLYPENGLAEELGEEDELGAVDYLHHLTKRKIINATVEHKNDQHCHILLTLTLQEQVIELKTLPDEGDCQVTIKPRALCRIA